MTNIDCVLIIYKPDTILLSHVISGIIGQVRNCYIVNNDSDTFTFKQSNIITVNLGKNYGIAYAQNIGINLAKQNNVDFILFSDQDTIYPQNFVAKMMDAYEYYFNKDEIGALVPRFYDQNKMRKTKIAINKFKYIVPHDDKVYHVAHAISSGSIIPIKCLDVVGVMREDLFIDWVDFEWCCRALKHGYKIVSIPGVSIEHKMGDRVRKIGNKKVTIRSRVRYYYLIRNGIFIILHTDALTIFERIFFLKDICIKALGICLIEKNSTGLLAKAVHDGITGKMYEIQGEY
ncbi:rhamnosyltransferase [Spirochaetia bacterium]|nr:rhamnosyltransferase [Spirochaetia bacterium]